MDPAQEQDVNQAQQPKRRRRYKEYGDPTNEGMSVPKGTQWRHSNLPEAVPVKRAKSGDIANQSSDEDLDLNEADVGEGHDHQANCSAQRGNVPSEDTENSESENDTSTEKSEGDSSLHSMEKQQSQSDISDRGEISPEEMDPDEITAAFSHASGNHNSESEGTESDDSNEETSRTPQCENKDNHNTSSDSHHSSGSDGAVHSQRHDRSRLETISSLVSHCQSVTNRSVRAVSMASGDDSNEDGDDANLDANPTEIEIPLATNSNTEAAEDDDDTSSTESDENCHPVDDHDDDDVGFSDLSEGSDTEHEEQAGQPSPPGEPQPPELPYDEHDDQAEDHPVPEAPPPPRQPDAPLPYQFLRTKLLGEYSERIENRVAASRGEILLNIQEYCKRHPMPLTAQEDLHKLVNSIFYTEIIPETTYKLDKLYGSVNKAQYFFYCFKCFENFGELDHKTMKEFMCPVCDTNNVIHDLTKAHYFVMLDFVQQLQLLLENEEVASQLKNPNEFENNGEVLKDLHDGTMYKKFVASLEFREGRYYITLTACTDGTPPFSSGCLSIWPIFVIINELPKYIRMNNVLLAGLWFGRKHPKMDLFLEPFADKIRVMSFQGFTVNLLGEARLYFAYLIAVCADSGARGPIQCVHAHNGECSCNWCLHPGVVEGAGSNARKFPWLPVQPEERKHDQVITDGLAVIEMLGNDNHVNGVTGLSPLLRCPKFNIVQGMVLDHLHWASFGVARRMGKLWLGEAKKKKKKRNEGQPQQPIEMPSYYVGSDETKCVISERISKLRPPREVRRLPRPVTQVNDYNAREWENMILYFSIPVFKNILPEKYLKHWILFVQAFYLLIKADVVKSEVEVAGTLMENYVHGVEELYGEKEMTFNVHLCLHAKENALRWSNGSCISTFAFENGNKELKKKIHAERGLGHQLLRSLDRESSLHILRSLASTPQSSDLKSRMERKEVKKSIFVGSVRCIMPSSFKPSREEKWHCEQLHINAEQFLECRRIISENVCYSVDYGKSRTDNSYACCVNGSVVKIRKIIVCEMSADVYLFVSTVRCTPYSLPRNVTTSNFSPFMYTVNLVERGTKVISCQELKTICVNISINDRFLKEQFICVMSNTCNVF